MPLWVPLSVVRANAAAHEVFAFASLSAVRANLTAPAVRGEERMKGEIVQRARTKAWLGDGGTGQAMET